MAKARSDNLSFEEFESSIRQKKFFPLYLLCGEEDYLIEEAVELITKEVLDESTRSFNLDVLYGSDVDAKEIVSLANSYPMMGDRRLVIVREFDKIIRKDLLLSLIEHPSPSTCLVLISDKPDFRQKLFRMIKENGMVAEFRQLYDSDIPGWINKRIQKLGKKATPEACQLMQAYVGRSLREIHNEIDKLFIYVGEKKNIDVEDVSHVVGISKQYNIFELQKAVGQMNIKLSVEILERMMNAGESPIGIIVMLTRYFQKMWLLQELRQKIKNETELAAMLGIRPFALREFNDAAARYTSEQIENCFSLLLIADETLKSTMTDPKLVMTVLVYKIIKGNSIGVRAS